MFWLTLFSTILGVGAIILALYVLIKERANVLFYLSLAIGIVLVGIAWWGKTHHIVPVQHVGIAVNTVTQEMSPPQDAGIIKKPFFSTVYNAPSATSYERCERYYPAVKGGYEIFVDLCFYYDTTRINWVDQMIDTGRLDPGKVMDVWRNRVVSLVVDTFNGLTPKEVGSETRDIEESLYKVLAPRFAEDGVVLSNISFSTWDFTNETVAAEFDKSIASQTKVSEQEALLEAAALSREREEYEADTAILVAKKKREAFDELGLSEDQIVQWLWVQLLMEQGKAPDTVILGTVPITVPAK